MTAEVVHEHSGASVADVCCRRCNQSSSELGTAALWTHLPEYVTCPGQRYPTWKYRYFRIRFFERYPDQLGLGLVWWHRDGQLTLTLGRWDITWGKP